MSCREAAHPPKIEAANTAALHEFRTESPLE
jgi:hypothetical protein